MSQLFTRFPNFAPFALALPYAGAGVGSMTAILNEIRALDDRLSRGELTPEEYSTLRETVLQSVEDAHTEFEPITPRPDRADRSSGGLGVWGFSLVVCLGTMGLSIGFILLLLPDLNLALTLGVTVLAALTVAMLHHSDD